ncbi:MAG: alcohol dehydrogenase catalytic domain-containing protein [Spirochaetaceae bacterium]|nr:MAG: alcohol dehydrogenase catalytic domain-containing protein [Spirochaetaceae bacterium]
MKAAVLSEPGQVEIREIPIPDIPNPDWVLVKTQAVGICGSEISAFEGTHPFRKAPVILGHEMSGTVTDVGRNVGRVKVGERVVVDPQWVCGECRYCKLGDLNLCPSKKFLGTADWPGGFGEYVAVPQTTLFPLPDSLSFAQGAAIESLSVAVHIAGRAALNAGHTAGVLGCGSIGGLFSAVSRHIGAAPIVAADIHQHCLDTGCKRLGASHGFLLPDPTFRSRVSDITDGEGLDVVAVCADDAALFNLALDIVKKRGIVVIVALLTEQELQFTAYSIIHKEANIIGTYAANLNDFRQAIQLAGTQQVDVAAIVTHELPIERAQLGFELASTKQDGAIKVVMTFS